MHNKKQIVLWKMRICPFHIYFEDMLYIRFSHRFEQNPQSSSSTKSAAFKVIFNFRREIKLIVTQE